MYVYARANKTSGALLSLRYIQAHWQPGDIVYHFGDDSWINTTPYNNYPNYMAPDCGPTLGQLSPATRQAIGVQTRPLNSLSYKRAWVIWSDGPLEPSCWTGQLQSLGLDPAKPITVTEDNEYVTAGLWLLERK
jgi:hypothetical protein